MTTLREAAQQALEALDKLYLPGELERVNAAITALRAALAQQVEPLNLRDPAVQKRLATQWGYVPAAQAEPVAWIYQNMYTEQEYLVWKKGTGGRNWRPLYAAPPQRKPLTEEEKRALADKFLSCQPESYEVSGVFDLISAVERAHGIKE